MRSRAGLVFVNARFKCSIVLYCIVLYCIVLYCIVLLFVSTKLYDTYDKVGVSCRIDTLGNVKYISETQYIL